LSRAYLAGKIGHHERAYGIIRTGVKGMDKEKVVCYYCGKEKHCPATVIADGGERPVCEWCAAEQSRDWQALEELQKRENVRLLHEEAASGEDVDPDVAWMRGQRGKPGWVESSSEYISRPPGGEDAPSPD
jgi:hypothetical protein